jgi:hypothetical protein
MSIQNLIDTLGRGLLVTFVQAVFITLTAAFIHKTYRDDVDQKFIFISTIIVTIGWILICGVLVKIL